LSPSSTSTWTYGQVKVKVLVKVIVEDKVGRR